MTREINFRDDNSQCVWKGSMLDTVLPFSGTLNISKAYPAHSAFVAKRSDEGQQCDFLESGDR